MKIKPPSEAEQVAIVMRKVADFWRWLMNRFDNTIHASIITIDTEKDGVPIFVVGDITKAEMQKVVDSMPEHFDEEMHLETRLQGLKDRADDGSH